MLCARLCEAKSSFAIAFDLKQKYLQVQSFLKLALVPVRSLSLLEATAQTADHVREQVGPD